MLYNVVLLSAVQQSESAKNKILMEILLYMIARLFTDRVNKVLVLILDFYHLLFSTNSGWGNSKMKNAFHSRY